MNTDVDLGKEHASEDGTNWGTATAMALFHVGAIAALFFAHYLSSGDISDALSRAASSVFGVLAKTVGTDSGEIQLVAAQDEIVNPSRLFEAKALGP